MSEMVVPQVKDGATIQGTPVQFSKAAFFQRTLISSRLNEAFRLISKGCFSLFVFPPNGTSPLELDCAIPNIGSNRKGKNLNFILLIFKVNESQIFTFYNGAPNFTLSNFFRFRESKEICSKMDLKQGKKWKYCPFYGNKKLNSFWNVTFWTSIDLCN